MKGSNISRGFFWGGGGSVFCNLYVLVAHAVLSVYHRYMATYVLDGLCSLSWLLGSGERHLGKFCQVNEDMVLALEDLRSARTKTYLSISWFGSSTESFLTTLKDGVFPPFPQVFFYISLLTSITFHFIVQLCVVKVVSVLRCEFFEDIHAYTTGFRILLFT